MKKCHRTIAARLLLFVLAFCFPAVLHSQNNPPLTVTIYDSAATSGYIFMVPYIITPPYVYDHPQMILDRYGNIVYYRVFMTGGIATTTADFKLQPNGLMSFFSPVMGRFYLMDSTFTVVDSVVAGNGYGTDTHELQVLPDGHYLILGREMRIKNLTAYHWFGPSHTMPGSPNAEVTGSVVQELDENKNVIFEWHAHDNFEFDDVDSVWLSNPTSVDWTHSNALERDYDGNILLSSRHLNEITKINVADSTIMWRMGGKNNEFDFINDTLGYTGQHDIRRHANGHVTLWDNGQYTDPPLGRSLEYILDETAKTATLVWGYVQDSGMFSYAMGNHQLLQNNDRFLTYGFITPPYPMVARVKSDSSKVLEIAGPPGYGCYRAFNYESLPFSINRPSVSCEKTGDTWYLMAEPGHSEYLWSTGATTQSIEVGGTGRYQVFVPYGNGGHVGSEIVRVTDPDNPCGLSPVPVNLVVQDVVVAGSQANCYDASHTIYVAGNGTNFEVLDGGTATLIAGVNIVFEPGVHVHSGGILHGTIASGGQYCALKSTRVETQGTFAERDGSALSAGQSLFRVYPNPTSGAFTIEPAVPGLPGSMRVEIFSIDGRLLLSQDFAGSRQYSLSLSNAPDGIWFVKILAGDKVETIKMIKHP